MPHIEPIQSLTLDLPPSCIEFWPDDSRYAVVGTYNLEKQTSDKSGSAEEGRAESQRRNGSLILLHVGKDNVSKIIHTLSTPSAILDIHFTPKAPPNSVFGVATSTGAIGIYDLKQFVKLENSDAPPEVTHLRTVQFFPEDTLVTAFSWHPKGTLVGMTLSTGQVCLGDIDLNNPLDSAPCWDMTPHELEAWTLAFSPDGTGLYSGGDDSVLRFTELPEISALNHEEIDVETPSASWTDKKIHGAGVTAILPLTASEEGVLVLTGSYDDHIRLIYVPIAGRRKILAELNIGGGVWRLKCLNKFAPSSPIDQHSHEILLLVSCMHAGARILRLSEGQDEQWRFEVLAKFEEHKSMNYGSDCQPALNEKGQRTFVTTSFYDRLLCLWRF
ncbi:WD40-repeat-containing domain protein [Massariosphaeria phaeospora]|uniref:methylated diphthine methylhydrolase n=1 Tax=Massariosphaeria phaeospora TaxID=100035 RepID=A0A7C8I984_9PLEO|nr:WD40-repeat-containing domain protein [Massariosphaeria phaeospora]